MYFLCSRMLVSVCNICLPLPLASPSIASRDASNSCDRWVQKSSGLRLRCGGFDVLLVAVSPNGGATDYGPLCSVRSTWLSLNLSTTAWLAVYCGGL
ncbi:hypothetical protein C8Q77DRAFT_220539 [Trametes polyzona]|nr:hypothetical protein C8Q77DRAFT_220539 [Trametes polyzona]